MPVNRGLAAGSGGDLSSLVYQGPFDVTASAGSAGQWVGRIDRQRQKYEHFAPAGRSVKISLSADSFPSAKLWTLGCQFPSFPQFGCRSSCFDGLFLSL